jgi:cysteine desulfurase
LSLSNLIHAKPEEIVWTSGATESINLALKGLMEFHQNRGRHLITFKTEHKAVLESCKALEKKGFEVSYLKPLSSGLVDFDAFMAAIRKDTVLVSLLHVNNETGVIQDIQKMAEYCREHRIYLHVDAAQSLGKVNINLAKTPVDLMSFSAHKCYGPKGIGALFLRQQPRVKILPQINGGGQEQGLRSGTLATHQIVGFGRACQIVMNEFSAEISRIQQLRDRLWNNLKIIPGVHLNHSLTDSVAHYLNFNVMGVEGESLLFALNPLAISSGSACNSTSIQPSHVLMSMGVPPAIAHRSIRISLGRFTTIQEIDEASLHIKKQIAWLRSLGDPFSD